MRTLKLHFPDEALPTLDTYLKQTKEARVFVVPKPCARLSKASASTRVRRAALDLFRLAQVGPSLRTPGIQGLVDRPRPSTPESHLCTGQAP